jgi:hypothetical protein
VNLKLKLSKTNSVLAKLLCGDELMPRLLSWIDANEKLRSRN